MDEFKTYKDDVIDMCCVKYKYKNQRNNSYVSVLFPRRELIHNVRFLCVQFYQDSIRLLFLCCDIIINSVSAPLMTVFNVSFDIGLCW